VVKEGEEPKKGNAIMIGEVLNAGYDVKSIEVGDRVVFAPFGFDEVEVVREDNLPEKLVIISEDLILAIYE
jgi:co-chaperonin GroES (HSP10)